MTKNKEHELNVQEPTAPTPDASPEQASHASEEAPNACFQELTQTKDQLMRVSADFENFKRRVEKDRAQWTTIAQADVLRNVLPIVDDFDRALAQKRATEMSAEQTAWLSGFEMIAKSLQKLLSTAGLQEITDLTVFDPQFHEAIAQVDSPDHASGKIVSVVQRGYIFKGTVLRPARVTVAR